jgi:hypothetical protein
VPLGAVTVAGNTARWNLSSGHIVTRTTGADEISVDEFVEIWFLGFKCWEESTELSSSDEPYFIVSYGAPGRSITAMHKYSKIDKGEQVIAPKLLGTQLPVVTALLHAAVMENDEGSPSEAREKVSKAMQDVAAAAQQAAAIYDMSAAAAGNDGALSPAADIAGLLVGGPLGTLIARGLVGGLGLADDYVGERGAVLFDKAQGYGKIPIIGTVDGEDYTHKFWIDGGDDGKYDLFFRVHKYIDPRPYV